MLCSHSHCAETEAIIFFVGQVVLTDMCHINIHKCNLCCEIHLSSKVLVRAMRFNLLIVKVKTFSISIDHHNLHSTPRFVFLKMFFTLNQIYILSKSILLYFDQSFICNVSIFTPNSNTQQKTFN